MAMTLAQKNDRTHACWYDLTCPISRRGWRIELRITESPAPERLNAATKAAGCWIGPRRPASPTARPEQASGGA